MADQFEYETETTAKLVEMARDGDRDAAGELLLREKGGRVAGDLLVRRSGLKDMIADLEKGRDRLVAQWNTQPTKTTDKGE